MQMFCCTLDKHLLTHLLTYLRVWPRTLSKVLLHAQRSLCRCNCYQLHFVHHDILHFDTVSAWSRTASDGQLLGYENEDPSRRWFARISFYALPLPTWDGLIRRRRRRVVCAIMYGADNLGEGEEISERERVEPKRWTWNEPKRNVQTGSDYRRTTGRLTRARLLWDNKGSSSTGMHIR